MTFTAAGCVGCRKGADQATISPFGGQISFPNIVGRGRIRNHLFLENVGINYLLIAGNADRLIMP